MPTGESRFGRDRRIGKSEEFARILKTGSRGSTPVLSIVLTPTEGAGRIGISAPTKIGGSVQRNRARRLVREYYRQTYRGSAPYDIVINLKPGFAELSAAEVRREIEVGLLKAIASGKRAGERARTIH